MKMTDEQALDALDMLTALPCCECPILNHCTYDECVIAGLYQYVGELICKKDDWNRLIDSLTYNPGFIVTADEIRRAFEINCESKDGE